MVKLPGSGRPNDLFSWDMWPDTAHAGKSLFLTHFDGTAAVSPAGIIAVTAPARR